VPQTAKSLVIDVNITCAASEKETADPITKSSRDFLKCMVETTRHNIVLTDAIRAEQRKHPSKFGDRGYAQ
jgi:hypothetical protein